MSDGQTTRGLARSPSGVAHRVSIEHEASGRASVRTACGRDADPKTWERLGRRDEPGRRCQLCFP